LFLGVATYGQSRPDVGAAFGARFTNSGYRLQASVPPGNYTIIVYMHSSLQLAFNSWVVTPNVTVGSTNSSPNMGLDLTSGITRTRPFIISGWAFDWGATPGPGIDAIHVWAFPVNGAPAFFVGATNAGLPRPDVAAFFGDSRFNNSGFSLTLTNVNVPAPGTYDFRVFGRSTVAGAFNVARTVRVTVQ
jgi:hypothetical protein